MKILWLVSWYPNPYEPFNGDFIQRHAQEVAEFIPVDVIHVLQTGSRLTIEKELSIINKKDNLTEYIHAFAFKPSGNSLTDILRYNILYHRYYKKIIKAYFIQHGKPDLVHVHVPVKAGLMALHLLKKYNIPYIVSEHSSHYESSSPDYFFNRSKYFQRNTKRIFKNAVAVTNVSATIGKKLQSIFEIKNYRTIHNLVNTNLFYYTPQPGSDKLRFIHVSAMGEQKNPAGIIQALAQLNNSFNNWECIFCGPLKEELQLLTKQCGLETQICFSGEISYEQVAAEMQQADIFILFSNHENFPCVIIEALCCGLPVIAANAGGIAEAINEKNGIMITPGDENQLSAAMLYAARNIDKYNRKKIAAGAAALYNQKTIATQFIQLYKEIYKKIN